MDTISTGHGLALAGVLFLIGLAGLLVRRNLLFMLMALEVMLNATALAFVTAGSSHLQADGQIMMIFALTMAAAEVAVGLALVLGLRRQYLTVEADEYRRLRG